MFDLMPRAIDQLLLTAARRVGYCRPLTSVAWQSPVNAVNKQPLPYTVAVAMSGGVDSSVAAAVMVAHAHTGRSIPSLLSNGFDVNDVIPADATKKPLFRVVGVHMSNWDAMDEVGTPSVCIAEEEYAAALSVCRHLRIPLRRYSFAKQYWNHVFTPFLEEYGRGRTPNPDILCNKHVKFGVFRRSVVKLPDQEIEKTEMPPPDMIPFADFLVTGHYAQLYPSIDSLWDAESDATGYEDVCTTPKTNLQTIRMQNGQYVHTQAPCLVSATDGTKDQSDFLAGVSGSALSRVLFPCGRLPKRHIRALAEKLKIPTSDRRDSYGICFIGKRQLKEFLRQYIDLHDGEIINMEDGAVLGRAETIEAYTVGQGAKIGGSPVKYYVVQVQNQVQHQGEQRRLLVAPGRHNAALFSDCAVINKAEMTWNALEQADSMVETAKSQSFEHFCDAMRGETGAEMPYFRVRYRIRHRQTRMGTAVIMAATAENVRKWGDIQQQHCVATLKYPWKLPDDASEVVFLVKFDVPQRAVAPGQVIVFYSESSIPDATTSLTVHSQATDSHDERVEDAWQDAGAAVLGCAVIGYSGPSHLQRGIPSPLESGGAWHE